MRLAAKHKLTFINGKIHFQVVPKTQHRNINPCMTNFIVIRPKERTLIQPTVN